MNMMADVKIALLAVDEAHCISQVGVGLVVAPTID